MTPSSVITSIFIGISEEEQDKGIENLFQETIAENFPYLGKGTDIQVKETETLIRSQGGTCQDT